jgi:hypothetical protein
MPRDAANNPDDTHAHARSSNALTGNSVPNGINVTHRSAPMHRAPAQWQRSRDVTGDGAERTQQVSVWWKMSVDGIVDERVKTNKTMIRCMICCAIALSVVDSSLLTGQFIVCEVISVTISNRAYTVMGLLLQWSNLLLLATWRCQYSILGQVTNYLEHSWQLHWS